MKSSVNEGTQPTEDIIRRITEGTSMIEDALSDWVDVVEEIKDTRLPNLLSAFQRNTSRLSEIAVSLAQVIRDHYELDSTIRDTDGASNEETE